MITDNFIRCQDCGAVSWICGKCKIVQHLKEKSIRTQKGMTIVVEGPITQMLGLKRIAVEELDRAFLVLKAEDGSTVELPFSDAPKWLLT